ncbi:Ribonuclease H [Pseudozyma hubeiensis]|nr:Ribonuclease H [Pseudozyma hubeiensis]
MTHTLFTRIVRARASSLHRPTNASTSRSSPHALLSSAAAPPTNIYPSRLSSFLPPHYHLRNVIEYLQSTIARYDMGKAKSGGGYYAVQKGRQQGVFRSWSECEAVTKGFAGAVFKKFDSEGAAKQFVNGDGYGASASSSTSGSTASGSKASSSSARSFHPYAPSKHKKPSHHHTKPPLPPRSNPIFPSTSSTTTTDVRKTIVYCDGSSIGNGTSSARAGWGVFFEDPSLHHLNESRRLPGLPQTNNRAELMALIRAIQLCPDDGRQLVVLSDSRYSMDAVNKWLPNWRNRGFKTVEGKDVQNRDLIEELDRELMRRVPQPKLEYVKGHAGIDGNEIVDRMAKYGASLEVVEEAAASEKVMEERKGLEEKNGKEEGRAVKEDEKSMMGFTINVSISPTKERASMGWR